MDFGWKNIEKCEEKGKEDYIKNSFSPQHMVSYTHRKNIRFIRK